MGISNLGKLIKLQTKRCCRERSLEYYRNKRVAIDASMCMYQFLIAIRTDGMALGTEDTTTSHIIGMFYRTIGIVESGLKVLFVFDGKPPQEKLNELLKRKEKREKANIKLDEAKEIGKKEDVEMYEKRKIKVTSEHVNDCKKILDLLKVPYITAPSEAEAYCAYLNKIGKVDAVASEDMDALTFGAPLLLRNVTASKSKKLPIREYNLSEMLRELELNQDEFIDLCILLGCDFSSTIKGVGPKTAFNLIKKYRSIEAILENEDLKLPDDFSYKKARLIFKELGDNENDVEIEGIKWNEVNPEEIKEFLVNQHNFNEDRVTKAVERYLQCKNKGIQCTLDSFFLKKK